ARSGAPLAQALARAFRAEAATLDDPTAGYPLHWALGTSPQGLRATLAAALDERRGKQMSVAEATDLVRKFLGAEVFGALAPLTEGLLREEDERRFVIERDVLVPTPDGARICALVVRPRGATGPLPTLLNFTIYASEQNMVEARRSASHGYAAVEGLTRGKGCSPDAPVSHEHDGADAAALIEWIARQPWSDGRVGMYGGSYEGFTQWAAARRMPGALKAMMPSVTHAPGIDFPTDGGIFATYAYPWPFYTTNGRDLDNATYNDSARWNRLQREWYRGGRAYRDLALIDGTPNPAFDRWLSHPAYDDYWKGMIPYGGEFAAIDIPVLTTTGYYDGGQVGALYYFREHYRHRPGAEHYLLVGPYDHTSGQRGTLNPFGRRTGGNVFGYEIDPVAHIDVGQLRYQWFDYVFRGAPRPAILQDRVNYQVMGADRWRHAPSLDAMHEGHLRIGLDTAVVQTVDLADRSDADRMASGEIIDQSVDRPRVVDTAHRIANAITFASEPFAAPTEISGSFSARLDFVTNKRDFDVSVTLFEVAPDGTYFQLSHHLARASHIGDREHRRLLTPGQRHQLDFTSDRLTSRLVPAGSRLVVVLAVVKHQGTEINYGTGKPVREETIADAGEPLVIHWNGGTFVDVPLGR
ncbi:MAG TPA: CocE/NonD family hydrolase, partial [Longimicrobium sp.]|nr:CocE/NonD family hydrolase [Longimicrobium sp.]